MARSFGDVMRDIGRALGIGGGGGGRASERSTNRVDIPGMTYSGLAPVSSPRPQSRPSVITTGGNRDPRAGRDGPDRPVEPVAPTEPEAPVEPVAPVTPPVTPRPPRPPRPVNPSDMTSTGPVEDAAIASVQGGRKSTILTSAQGLLPEDEPVGLLRDRRRLGRSLLGQGLIQ
jgi:hypothetical protein